MSRIIPIRGFGHRVDERAAAVVLGREALRQHVKHREGAVAGRSQAVDLGFQPGPEFSSRPFRNARTRPSFDLKWR